MPPRCHHECGQTGHGAPLVISRHAPASYLAKAKAKAQDSTSTRVARLHGRTPAPEEVTRLFIYYAFIRAQGTPRPGSSSISSSISLWLPVLRFDTKFDWLIGCELRGHNGLWTSNDSLCTHVPHIAPQKTRGVKTILMLLVVPLSWG